MDILRLIGSVICAIFAIIIGIFSSLPKKHNHRDKINDVPRYMKRGFVNKYYGRHESEYTNIDDAQFHYALDRMKHEIGGGGGKRKKNESTSKTELIKKKKNDEHRWYKYKEWELLFSNNSDWKSYLNDRKEARIQFLFYWDEVFTKVMPLVRNEKYETIGVLRVHSDNKTLFVYGMEKSPTIESTGSYAAGIPYHLVKKYANMPGYFLFHTHPMGINADPLPSDADLYSCLLDCYVNRFVGHVVIGEYGAIVYFLKTERMEQLESGGDLKYFTYCYDLISAWNAICNSSGPINQRDRINFLEKWGFDMIIIPSPYYIADAYDKLFLPNVIHDRFTKTKYELLDKIKEFIKKLEAEDERKNNK